MRDLSTSDNGRDPFNQHSDRFDREKRTTSKGGPVFSKLFRLDRTDPLSFGPKFPEILVEWIAPLKGPNSVMSIPFILSGSPNECWLHTCDACVITNWRLGLRAPLVVRNKQTSKCPRVCQSPGINLHRFPSISK